MEEDENKRNIQYFEEDSMRQLYNVLQLWQEENKKRFLSLSIEMDRGKFCCIALTNPTETVIVNGFGSRQAEVADKAIRVFNV